MRKLVQPHDWPCTIASISALDANAISPALGRSGRRRASRSRDSLNTRAARATVTRPTGGDEQGGGDDGVAAEDPGQGGVAGACEVALEAGEGDVDDEKVEAGNERGDGDDCQNTEAVWHSTRPSWSVA